MYDVYLDKISRPHRRPLDEGWYNSDWDYMNSLFFVIRADFVDNLDVEVRRCRWAEQLKIVNVFNFWSAHPRTMVTIGGQQISQISGYTMR